MAPRLSRGAICVSETPNGRLQARKAQGYAHEAGKPCRFACIAHPRIDQWDYPDYPR
jgi:hypothetical protein